MRRGGVYGARRLMARLVVYVTVLMGGVVLMMPFLWMISTALKTPKQIYTFPPTWIPKPVAWGNFREAWTFLPFTTYLRNSLITTVVPVLGTVLSSSLVAFSFARLRWPGRDFWFVVMLSTLMLPPQVTIIPQFIMFRYLGWIDTFKPLIIPPFFAGGAFYVFLLRQFYLTIPPELEDAARLDGCSSLQMWARVILPLSKPALSSAAVLSFVGHWQDFWGPLIYLHSPQKYTMPLGLAFLRMGAAEGPVTDHYMMAIAFLMMLPTLLLFFVAQRAFIGGIVLTGMKE